MTERDYRKLERHGMYGVCASVGLFGAFLIFLGSGLILSAISFLVATLVAATFSWLSFRRSWESNHYD